MNVQPISKGKFLAGIFGPIALIFVIGFGASLFVDPETGNGSAALGAGVMLLMLASLATMVVTICMLIYKMWDAIQDGHARTSPGKAIGFMFIPFFNLYWIFQAYYGWTVDYNKLVQRHQVQGAQRMPEGLALTMCILTLATIIPILGIFIALVNCVLMIVFFNSAINGVNSLVGATTAAPQAEMRSMAA